MSEDKFDNRRPQIAFSEETVTVRGRQGERLQGEFFMHSTNEVSIRGIVYSSNPYVRIVKPQFDGMEATIRFEVLGQDYQEGDRLTGYFLHRDIGQKPCSCFIRRLLKSSLQDRKRQSAWSIPAIVRLYRLQPI